MKHPEQAAGRNRSRWKGQGDEWETPPEFFCVLNSEFGFTLDPCATATTAKVERYFTTVEDGLTQSWAGETVFMNPPYGRASVAKWMQKAADEVRNGAVVVCLVPAATDTEWWHQIAASGSVRYIRGRLPFRVAGGKWNSPFSPVVVIVLGREDETRVSYEVTQRRGVPTVARIAHASPSVLRASPPSPGVSRVCGSCGAKVD